MQKILAIDDNMDNLISLSALLKNLMPECSVITAQSGREGIEKAIAEQPDTILLDVRMPDMGGFETLQRLKTDENTKHIPVIVLTAIKTDSKSRARGLELGADAFLAKPIDETELVAQVKVALRIKKAEDALREELKSASRRIEALWSVTSLVDADVKVVSDHILKSITKMTDSDFGFYGFISEDQSVMTIHSWSGEAMKNCSMVDKPAHFPIHEAGVWGEAIRRREPLILNDYTAEHSGKKGLPQGHVQLTNLLVVPLMVKDRITSVAAVANRAADYTQNDVTQIQSFLNSIQAIVTGKRMEEALAQKAALLAQTEAISHTGSWRHDLATGKVTWSDEMYAIFGMDREAFNHDAEQAIDLSVHPEDRLLLYAVNSAVRKDGIPRPLDYRIIRPDGSVHWVHAQGEQELDPTSGRVVALVGFVQDITERKQLESERDRLITAIEQTPEAIVITDLQGNIEYVNPAFEKVTGYTKNEVMGQNPRILKSGQHDTFFYTDLWKTITSGRAWKGRLSNKRKDGSLYLEDTTITPVFDKSGKITTLVAIKRDVTADVRMEEKLRQSQKMEALATLAGGIAHDFNNILSSVLGFAELVKLDVEGNEEAVDNVDQILAAGLRARELVRHIVTFSRMADVQKQPMEIVSLVKESLKFLRASIPAHIEIRHFFDGTVGPIMADPFQIHQVLMNLFTNAAHAMDTKGGILEVRLNSVDIKSLDTPTEMDSDRELKPGTYLQLTVSDTGCGIPKEAIEHIFEPFFSTKPRGEGTGMGLATVYGIIKDMNGTLSVQSEPDKGTVFQVMIPEFRSTCRSEERSVDLLSLKGKGRILLVDDELPIIRWTRQVLVKLGYDVVDMTDSLEALERFKQEPQGFDLVLTDMTMPQMSGLELSKRITEIRPELPVILLTGFSKGLTPATMKESGVYTLIMKPMIAGELAQVVRKALGQDIVKIMDKGPTGEIYDSRSSH